MLNRTTTVLASVTTAPVRNKAKRTAVAPTASTGDGRQHGSPAQLAKSGLDTRSSQCYSHYLSLLDQHYAVDTPDAQPSS